MTVAHGIGLGERTGNELSGGRAAPPARRRSRLTPYLLLLPGLGWLVLFFVVPIVTLLSTSTQTRPRGAEIGVYEQTFRFANYVDAVSEYAVQFGRSSATRSWRPCWRWSSPTRWPTQSRSRPAAGATCCWC